MDPNLAAAAQLALQEGRRSSVLHADLTDKIIRAFFTVYNYFGYGFLESVYVNALVIELRAMGLHVETEVPIDIWYYEFKVGHFRGDILVEGVVLLEAKAGKTIDATDLKQLLNVLSASKLEVGLLLHFGPEPNFRRLIASNARCKPRPNQR
jgi:GxxExxY protein